MTNSTELPTTPPTELIYAANRLLVIEKSRIRRVNAFMALARPALGVAKNTEISKADMESLVMQWIGTDRGVSLSDEVMDHMEKVAVNEIEQAVTGSPFNLFLSERSGMGAKTFGRLWALIGNPLYDAHNDKPRTVGSLFQYCGVGDPTDKRSKGKKLFHNPKVGPRLHNIAEPCIKLNGEPDKKGRKRARSLYRDVYDEAKEQVANRVHTMPCAQCGSQSAKQKDEQRKADEAFGGAVRLKNDVPAEAGIPWKPGHKHGHAMRMVKRAILRDIYNFSDEVTA